MSIQTKQRSGIYGVRPQEPRAPRTSAKPLSLPLLSVFPHDYFVLFHYSRPGPLSVTIFLSDSLYPQGGTFQMVSYLSQVKSHGRARVLCHVRTRQSQHADVIFLGGKASPRRLGGICRDKDILYPLLRDEEFEEKRLNN